MTSKHSPLPRELQDYLAQQARDGGFADASDYLRALLQQRGLPLHGTPPAPGTVVRDAGAAPAAGATPAATPGAPADAMAPAGAVAASDAPGRAGTVDEAGSRPPAATPPAPVDTASEVERLRRRLDRLRGALPHDPGDPRRDAPAPDDHTD